jgi:hypothetical protein
MAYWILKQTWNRRIVFGPYDDKPEVKLWLDAALKDNHIGGPVKYSVLEEIQISRIVKRAKGKIEVEELL